MLCQMVSLFLLVQVQLGLCGLSLLGALKRNAMRQGGFNVDIKEDNRTQDSRWANVPMQFLLPEDFLQRHKFNRVVGKTEQGSTRSDKMKEVLETEPRAERVMQRRVNVQARMKRSPDNKHDNEADKKDKSELNHDDVPLSEKVLQAGGSSKEGGLGGDTGELLPHDGGPSVKPTPRTKFEGVGDYELELKGGTGENSKAAGPSQDYGAKTNTELEDVGDYDYGGKAGLEDVSQTTETNKVVKETVPSQDLNANIKLENVGDYDYGEISGLEKVSHTTETTKIIRNSVPSQDLSAMMNTSLESGRDYDHGGKSGHENVPHTTVTSTDVKQSGPSQDLSAKIETSLESVGDYDYEGKSGLELIPQTTVANTDVKHSVPSQDLMVNGNIPINREDVGDYHYQEKEQLPGKTSNSEDLYENTATISTLTKLEMKDRMETPKSKGKPQSDSSTRSMLSAHWVKKKKINDRKQRAEYPQDYELSLSMERLSDFDSSDKTEKLQDTPMSEKVVMGHVAEDHSQSNYATTNNAASGFIVRDANRRRHLQPRLESGGIKYKFKIGQYPFESPQLVKSISNIVQKLKDEDPSKLEDKNFPEVANCVDCPDFDVCLKIESKFKCFRRTLDHFPCPELCDNDEAEEHHEIRKDFLKKRKELLQKLVKQKLIKTIDSCSECGKQNICAPTTQAKSDSEYRCYSSRLFNDFDNPCAQLVEKDGEKATKEYRILGHECVLASSEEKDYKSFTKHDLGYLHKYEQETVLNRWKEISSQDMGTSGVSFEEKEDRSSKENNASKSTEKESNSKKHTSRDNKQSLEKLEKEAEQELERKQTSKLPINNKKSDTKIGKGTSKEPDVNTSKESGTHHPPKVSKEIKTSSLEGPSSKEDESRETKEKSATTKTSGITNGNRRTSLTDTTIEVTKTIVEKVTDKTGGDFMNQSFSTKKPTENASGTVESDKESLSTVPVGYEVTPADSDEMIPKELLPYQQEAKDRHSEVSMEKKDNTIEETTMADQHIPDGSKEKSSTAFVTQKEIGDANTSHLKDCNDCFEKKKACLKLSTEAKACVSDQLIKGNDCMDLCPRAMKMTKSCEMVSPGNNTLDDKVVELKYSLVSCEKADLAKACDDCDSGMGCISITNYNDACVKSPSCDLCPKYTSCSIKTDGDRQSVVCDIKDLDKNVTIGPDTTLSRDLSNNMAVKNQVGSLDQVQADMNPVMRERVGKEDSGRDKTTQMTMAATKQVTTDKGNQKDSVEDTVSQESKEMFQQALGEFISHSGDTAVTYSVTTDRFQHSNESSSNEFDHDKKKAEDQSTEKHSHRGKSLEDNHSERIVKHYYPLMHPERVLTKEREKKGGNDFRTNRFMTDPFMHSERSSQHRKKGGSNDINSRWHSERVLSNHFDKKEDANYIKTNQLRDNPFLNSERVFSNQHQKKEDRHAMETHQFMKNYPVFDSERVLSNPHEKKEDSNEIDKRWLKSQKERNYRHKEKSNWPRQLRNDKHRKYNGNKWQPDQYSKDSVIHKGASAERIMDKPQRRHKITEFNDFEELPLIADPVKSKNANSVSKKDERNIETFSDRERKEVANQRVVLLSHDEKENHKRHRSERSERHKHAHRQKREPDAEYTTSSDKSETVEPLERKVIIREQDNPIKEERNETNNEKHVLRENKIPWRSVPQMHIDRNGQVVKKENENGKDEIGAERERPNLLPIMHIDDNGRPVEGKERELLLAQELPITQGPNGGGTMQAIRNKDEPVLDNDLVHKIEQQKGFVKNRENQVVDPVLNIDSMGRVVPRELENSKESNNTYMDTKACSHCNQEQLDGTETPMKSCLVFGIGKAICLSPKQHKSSCKEEEDICGKLMECEDKAEEFDNVKSLQYQCQLPESSSQPFSSLSDCDQCDQEKSTCFIAGHRLRCLPLRLKSEEVCTELLCPANMSCVLSKSVATCVENKGTTIGPIVKTTDS